jgi:hypothetical protein
MRSQIELAFRLDIGDRNTLSPSASARIVQLPREDAVSIMNQMSMPILLERLRNCCSVHSAVGYAVTLACAKRLEPRNALGAPYIARPTGGPARNE